MRSTWGLSKLTKLGKAAAPHPHIRLKSPTEAELQMGGGEPAASLLCDDAVDTGSRASTVRRVGVPSMRTACAATVRTKIQPWTPLAWRVWPAQWPAASAGRRRSLRAPRRACRVSGRRAFYLFPLPGNRSRIPVSKIYDFFRYQRSRGLSRIYLILLGYYILVKRVQSTDYRAEYSIAAQL